MTVTSFVRLCVTVNFNITIFMLRVCQTIPKKTTTRFRHCIMVNLNNFLAPINHNTSEIVTSLHVEVLVLLTTLFT